MKKEDFTTVYYFLWWFYRPFLWGSDEEGSQLAQDDQADVDEDAAQDRQRQQTGCRSAAMQLIAGAPSTHYNGQQSHQTKVQEEELQVSHVCVQLHKDIKRSHVSVLSALSN